LVRHQEVRVVDEEREGSGGNGEILEVLIDGPRRAESLHREHHEPDQQAGAAEQPEVRETGRQGARPLRLESRPGGWTRNRERRRAKSRGAGDRHRSRKSIGGLLKLNPELTSVQPRSGLSVSSM